MSIDVVIVAASSGWDTWYGRLARWVFFKTWFGAVLTGGFLIGGHYGWPDGIKTAAATFGAVALAGAVLYLPVWTRTFTTDLPGLDTAVKTVAWVGIAAPVVGLLIALPAAGAPAGALLLVAAVKTFGNRLEPIARRLRMERPKARTAPAPVAVTPPARRPAPGQRPRTAPTGHGRTAPAAAPGRFPSGPVTAVPRPRGTR